VIGSPQLASTGLAQAESAVAAMFNAEDNGEEEEELGGWGPAAGSYI